jgi:hypothetical protein
METGLHVEKLEEAAAEKPCACEQDECDRDLSDDEDTTRALA